MLLFSLSISSSGTNLYLFVPVSICGDTDRGDEFVIQQKQKSSDEEMLDDAMLRSYHHQIVCLKSSHKSGSINLVLPKHQTKLHSPL